MKLPVRLPLAVPSLVAALACAAATAGCYDDTACLTSVYPPAPAGVSGVVHVSAACGGDTPDGSALRPYNTIQAGIDHAPSGGAVLIAAGTYVENVTVSKPLMVLGGGPDGTAADAAVTVSAPQPNAVVVAAGVQGVLLRGLLIKSPVAVGVRVEGGASATLDRSRVEDTRPAVTGGGYGVLAVDDGSIIICFTRILRSAVVGVLFSKARGEVRDSVLESNGRTPGAAGQAGIEVEWATGEVWIHGNQITDSAVVGVGARSSAVRLTGNTITGTRADGQGFGDGILAAPLDGDGGGLTRLTVEAGNLSADNDRGGVVFSGDARGSILGSEFSRNAFGADMGAGIWAQGGAGAVEPLSITGNTVAGNRYLGIGLTTAASAVVTGGNTIRDTAAAPVFVGVQMVDIGDGVGVLKGAVGKVTGNTIDGNGRFGVIVAGGATGLVDQNSFSGNVDWALVVQETDPAKVAGQSNEYAGQGLKVVPAGGTPFVVSDADLLAPGG
jgi:hypothetical protein